MAILLILAFLILTFNFLFYKNNSFSLSIVYTLISFSVASFLITEISDFFDAYNFNSSVIGWSTLTFLGLILNRKIYNNNLNKINMIFIQNKNIFFILFPLFALLFIQGILYPPNNWDSMTYHMARISHWVMNESIEPYPTHIYRQIYQPPLAEWMIGQLCILNKGDFFANSLQLLFLIGILAVSNLILDQLKYNKRVKFTALILITTTPSVFMQATSTQNDIVVGFFIITSLYFILRYFTLFNWSSALLIGVNIGLALLTKGTAFVYMISVFLVTVILLIINLKNKKLSIVKAFPHFTGILLLCLLIPSPHFYRNFKLSNDIFGASDDNYFNEKINLKSTSLGIIKNIGTNLSTPITADITNQVVEKLHLVFNILINDKNYSYNGIPFKLSKWNHNEDEVSNFLFIFLFIGLLIFILFRWKKSAKKLKYLTLFCIFSFLIFSFILKWQPWHIRLLVPFFIMSCLPIAIFINELNLKKTTILIYIFSFSYVLLLALVNPNRPLIKNQKQAKLHTRFEKYFVAMPPFLKEYKILRYKLKNNVKTNWDVHGDTWEYPIYYDCFSIKRKSFNSINIKNQSKHLFPSFNHSNKKRNVRN
jgi:4-amino-4-deoxy-L-arabinose transferase-like glycosyltransferase